MTNMGQARVQRARQQGAAWPGSSGWVWGGVGRAAARVRARGRVVVRVGKEGGRGRAQIHVGKAGGGWWQAVGSSGGVAERRRDGHERRS